MLQYNLRDQFLDRDAGLFHEGFKENGVDSRYMALGDPALTANPEIVLADLERAMDPSWWRKWKLNGVLLYSWALPRFTGVAAAIKASGAKLVLILDTDGYASPGVNFRMFVRNKYYREKENSNLVPSIRALAKTLASSVKARHQPTLRHLELADVLALPSSAAKARYADFLVWANRVDLVKRLEVIPYPVSNKMFFQPGTLKERRLVAVGGWARLQKNAGLMMRVIGEALERRPAWSATIVGTGEDVCREHMRGLRENVRARITLTGPVPNDQLPAILQRSRISVCTSYHESFHLASAEALCCGCSIVADERISSMSYFVSKTPAGTLAPNLNFEKFCGALLAEMDSWDNGSRNAAKISETWTKILHPRSTAAAVLRAVSPASAPAS